MEISRLSLATTLCLSALVFCSCRAPMTREQTAAPAAKSALARPSLPYPVQAAAYNPPSLPTEAWTGVPGADLPPHAHAPGHHCPHCGPGVRPDFHFSDHVPVGPDGRGLQWVPDGISCPWPKDEFICDGGDLHNDAAVKRDWTVIGLDQEDTIAHYDTLDGKTEITASNCVCIYAPRFAAVRQVISPVLSEGHERMAAVEQPTKINIHEERYVPTTAVQPEQVEAQLGLDSAPSFRERTRSVLLENTDRLVLAADSFLPHENLKFIQRGEFDNHEKARLAASVAAAIVWTENKAVQVIIDGKPAVEAKATSKPQETVVYELLGKPRLRICKIADKSEAQVGEIITFTLRYDNVGEQKVGNVTVIDHLMPRLSYIEGSATGNLKGDFIIEPHDDTTVLRWEIADPLEVGEGGIIRFKARVR